LFVIIQYLPVYLLTNFYWKHTQNGYWPTSVASQGRQLQH